jgi:hypothetical protein
MILRSIPVCTFYLHILATSGTMGGDMRGWAGRVSAANEVKQPDRSLTVLLGVLETEDQPSVRECDLASVSEYTVANRSSCK